LIKNHSTKFITTIEAITDLLNEKAYDILGKIALTLASKN
jgi:hypothetical protein